MRSQIQQKHPFIIVSSMLGQKSFRQYTEITGINAKGKTSRPSLKNNSKRHQFYQKKSMKISNKDQSLQKFDQRISQVLKLQKKDMNQNSHIFRNPQTKQIPILLKIYQAAPELKNKQIKKSQQFQKKPKQSQSCRGNVIKGLNINDLAQEFIENSKFKTKSNTTRRNQFSNLKFINSKNGVKLEQMMNNIKTNLSIANQTPHNDSSGLKIKLLNKGIQESRRYSQDLNSKSNKKLSLILSSMKDKLSYNLNDNPQTIYLNKQCHVSSMILQRRPKSSKKLDPLDFLVKGRQSSQFRIQIGYRKNNYKKQQKNIKQKYFSPWKIDSQLQSFQ